MAQMSGLAGRSSNVPPSVTPPAKLPVAFLSSCPQFGHLFELLGGAMGKNGPPHRHWSKCSAIDDQTILAIDVREATKGSHIVIVGINNVMQEASMRTLVVAARSRPCVLMLTLEGCRAFVDFVSTMHPVERNAFLPRVTTIIMIGDHAECFHELRPLVPRARMRHIGGMHWSEKTCANIEEMIREGPLAPDK